MKMALLGVKFAPLQVPLERRLQTLASGLWIITMVFGGFVGIIVSILLLYTQYRWLILLYLAWIIYDRDIGNKGGRKLDWFRNLVWWKYYYKYFPLSLVKTAELSPERNYLLAAYPHGMLCSGVFGNFGTEAADVKKVFPGMTPYILTLDCHFILPFFREFSLSVGLCSASRKSLMYLLDEDKTKGKMAVLMVGGAQEAFYSRPGDYKIVLKNRKGFIKIAYETGTPIVPVFSFGEIDLFDQVYNPPGSLLFWFQNQIRKLIGIAPCIPIGRGFFQYSFGVIPRRMPVTTVVGAPIEVKKNENPSTEEIDNLHNIFTFELVQLFETHKYKFLADPENTHLTIL